MLIEFVRHWGSNLPGRVVDAGPGGALTEGQADLLVLRGVARPVSPAPVPVPAAGVPAAAGGQKPAPGRASKPRK